MVYVFIIFVVLLALAPLLHFLPSRRQREQASLREAAALAGLFVEFRDLPLPAAHLQRLAAAERQVLYYGRRLRPARGRPRANAAWWRVGDEWRRSPGTPEAPALTSELPAAVLALGVSEGSCGCYWREEGDCETVQQIAAFLLAWGRDLEALS
jgi:hypothetical protein